MALASSAGAEVFLSRYNVSVSGIPVGEAVIQATLGPKSYEVMISADVGSIFESTQIRGQASGTRAGAKLTPEHFRMALTGGERGAVDVNFAGNAASGGAGGTLNPRLKGVFDPLSALLVTGLKQMPAAANPCSSVLPIFTGHARFVLNLRPKPMPVAHSEPEVVVCQGDYSGLAGVPQDKPGQPGLEIAFVRVAKPHFWLVEHITLQTPKGEVSIERSDTSISG